MFSYFKSKPLLKELIPDNFVDIHSHILPGIDDGAKNLEDTIFLYGKMKKLGFDQIITTPHIMDHIWENTKSSINTVEETTKLDFQKVGNEFEIRSAAEYMMDVNFIKLFQSEKLMTIKNNHVLVEMSYLNAPLQLFDIIFELQIAGYIPILAHPERYIFYKNNFDVYEKLKKYGCFFQLNLLSAVGYYGENVFEIAKKLLEKGMIDFVGSDIHHENHVNCFQNKTILKDLNPLKEAIANNQFFRY